MKIFKAQLFLKKEFKNLYLLKNNDNFIFFLSLFIFFLIIISIIFNIYQKKDLIIHPDYQSIIIPVKFFLENNYWYYKDVNLISYQPLLQKILIYEIKLFENFFTINYGNFIPKLIIINNILFSFFSILFTREILIKFTDNKKYISILPFIYLSIIPFSFSIIELRNDNLLIFLTILFVFTAIKFGRNFNFRNIFIISVISALALSTREIAVTYIITFILYYLFINYKKIGFFKFLKFSFLYIFLTLILYFLISFRSFEVLENYYSNFPVFKISNYSKDLFFMSVDGTGYMSIFWYFNYFISSGYGFIITTLTAIGYLTLLFDKKFPIYKYILIIYPTIYFLVICFFKVYADRYTYPLIPFFVIFSIIAINKIYELIEIKKKFNFFFLILLIAINIKSILWISTFYKKSTRENAVIWINKNIEKNQTILFYNMFDVNNSVYRSLRDNYKIIQYSENTLEEIILNHKVKYILSGDNNLSYYYGSLYPFTLENNSNNAAVLNNWYKNNESFFIKISIPKKVFYNSIYQSGLFSKNFADHSNYMQNFFQPVIVLSEVKSD